MGAHAWVVVLTAAVIGLAVLVFLLNHQRWTWKHAFLFRVGDEQKANKKHPDGPSPYELARREITRHV